MAPRPSFPIHVFLSAAACLRDNKMPAALNQASEGSSDNDAWSDAERDLERRRGEPKSVCLEVFKLLFLNVYYISSFC